MNYCSEAEVYGIICFGMGLTLREGSREYFFRQLDHLFPGMKEKYLQTYGMQYQIVSNKNDELMQLFHHTCEKNGIVHDNRKIFEYLSTFETKCDNVQLSLFDKDFAGKSPNGIDDFLETVRRYTDATTITKRMVAELIDHIEVYHAEKQDGVTNQRVVIHYNCIGAFDVPDRRKIPEADIIMETRKGVALSYAPEQVAV